MTRTQSVADIGDLIAFLARMDEVMNICEEPLVATSTIIHRTGGEATYTMGANSKVGGRIITHLVKAYQSNEQTLFNLRGARKEAQDALNRLMGL